MTRLSVIVLCVSIVVLAVSAEEKYEEGRFAHINVDEVLGNQRILNSFIKCFIDQGPCTGDARDMKKLIPEIVDTKCGKCTTNQKKAMAKAMKFVKDSRPDDWELLKKKYDPEGKQEKDLAKFLEESLALRR